MPPVLRGCVPRLARSARNGYRQLRSTGVDLVIVANACEYRHAARLEDLLAIETQPEATGTSSLSVSFTVRPGRDSYQPVADVNPFAAGYEHNLWSRASPEVTTALLVSSGIGCPFLAGRFQRTIRLMMARPTAASGVNHGRTPVATGRTRPAAPRTSAKPVKTT